MNRRLLTRLFPYTLSLLLLSVSLYGSYRAVNGYSKAEVANTLQQRLNLHMSNFQSLLETHDYLPEVLANHPAVGDFISQPNNSLLKRQAGLYLNRFASTTGVESVYLLDSQGQTLLSGNNAPPVPVLSKDNQIRPYFTRAVAGLKTRRFWVDPRTNEAGIFFFSPIRDSASQVSGVSVVNAKLDDFEANWRLANELILITDLEGIIFITSRPEWRFSATETIDEASLTARELARYYNIDHIQSIDILKESPYSQNIHEVSIAGVTPEPYMVKSSVIPKSEWILQVYQETHFIKYRLIFAFIISGLVSIILLLITLYIMQRRRHIHELEGRVKYRTAELSTAIGHLKNEIRKKKQVETTLRQTQDGLIQAGKMAVLGQLATSITHELNQPLTALITYAENTLMLAEQDQSALVKRNLTSMTQLADRMASITRMLKTFAYDSREKTAPVLVSTAIHNTLSIVRMKYKEADIAIEYSSYDAELMVMANLVRLEQVLLNIITNAIDALAEHSVKRIDITEKTDGNLAMIIIKDTGPGIPEDQLQSIFEPFFTSKQQGSGLGLGLSISDQIIKSFNGELLASNSDTGGAIFTITIPLHQVDDHKNA